MTKNKPAPKKAMDVKGTPNNLKEIFGDIAGLSFGAESVDHQGPLVVFPFDCPPIDIPFGGGMVGGKIYEIFGEESHGKSLFVLDFTKRYAAYWNALKDPNYCILWIESESAFDKDRARYMGIPVDSKFVFFETDILEDARDRIKIMLDRCVQKKMKLLVVWDTIAAVSTRNEKEAADAIIPETEERDEKKGKSKINPGGLTEKPRLIKQMLRDITTPLGQTQSTFIIINQVITQVGKYGAPLDTGGGRGLRHHASVRCRLSKVDDHTETGPDGQQRLRAIVSQMSFAKNKITGFTKYQPAVYMDVLNGVDTIETRLIYLKQSKIIKPGGWMYVEIPTGYATKPQDKPEMIEIKFQTSKRFKELITEIYPHGLDWFDYQIYRQFLDDPMVKVKNIDKIWGFEQKFYGKRITKLDEREKETAEHMYAGLIQASDLEESGEAVEPEKPSGGGNNNGKIQVPATLKTNKPAPGKKVETSGTTTAQ